MSNLYNVTVNWNTINNPHAAEYRIYRRLSSSSTWEQVGTVSASTNQYIDEAVPGGNYEYKIEAYKNDFCIEETNIGTVSLITASTDTPSITSVNIVSESINVTSTVYSGEFDTHQSSDWEFYDSNGDLVHSVNASTTDLTTLTISKADII